jgi:endoglycosylceramidase
VLRPRAAAVRLTVLVTAVVLVPGLLALPAGASRALAPAGLPGSLRGQVTGLHVVHPGGAPGYLANGSGDFTLLRGVDENALIQYPSDYREAPAVHPGDFAEMAALGVDYVRLGVSWSRIMPEPGVIDQAYLRRVRQVIGWAARWGIGVVVDMHQDNYSVVTDPTQEADGAPAWAVLDGGAPCTPEITTTECALAAFKSFWANKRVDGKPLQKWYLEATTAVAKAAGATSSDDNVIGVELMNEPWPQGPSPFEQRSLYPFYDRMIAGLRRAGVVSPLWFQPSILRDVTDNATSQAARFSTDPDLVYAVHIYSGVFAPPYGPKVSLSEMAKSYANAATEAKTFGTPFVVDEFGSNAKPVWNSWLRAQLSEQNRYTVGSGFWLWKQRPGRWANWSVVNLNGSLHTTTLRAQLLGQPHVDTVPGRLLSTTAKSEKLDFHVKGNGGTATVWGGTVVTHGGPTVVRHSLHQVTVDGRAVAARCQEVTYSTSSTSLGGCLLRFPLPAGRHTVVVTP